jgi:uncharacterized protein
MYNILSLDGGGLRGIITATILERIEQELPGFLSRTSLFSGTSTGGILALSLASGMPPRKIIEMYEQQGPKIFKPSTWRQILGFFNLAESRYDNEELKKALLGVFGDTKLEDLKTRVTVPSFRLDNRRPNIRQRTWSPKIFHNFPGADSDGPVKVRDVALYTSSAPTYFPTEDGYIDGGVFANNPSLVALSQALDSRQDERDTPKLEEICLLSVGTGTNLEHIEGDYLDWGDIKWLKPLLDILMDGVSEVSDFQCRQLLSEHYNRIQMVFGPDEKLSMDDVNKIPRMKEIASQANLDEALGWIENLWMKNEVKHV